MPPPMSPPGFSTWSAHVPQWAWLTFAVILMFACAGAATLVYVLRELRAQRRGHRLPPEETLRALAHLEKRMQKIGTPPEP
jgi:type II secretory pathway component PulF